MSFDIDYDENNKPVYVRTDDGFMQTGRKFADEKDGWMLDQLNVNDFLAVKIGRQMELLINEVNALRRENFSFKQAEKRRHG